MGRARTLAVVVLLVSYGAVGARQPAVRSSVPLGVSASTVASTLGFAAADRGHLLVDVVRALFDAPDTQDPSDGPRRARLASLLRSPERGGGDLMPLPLDPSIWRDTLLQRPIADDQLIAAIFADRRTALLYHGLAALDDETLGALGPDRETLQLLLRHPGAFAAFGRSLRIRGGRVVVPGGTQADAVWQAIVGVEPTKPGVFVRRLFAEGAGRAAFFYDTVAHLDEPHQRFVLGMTTPYTVRVDRARALYEQFVSISPDWRVEERPFNRPQADPALTIALVAVTSEGNLAPPSHRRLWAHVLRGDESPALSFDPGEAAQVTLDADDGPADAAWLGSRVAVSRSSCSRSVPWPTQPTTRRARRRFARSSRTPRWRSRWSGWGWPLRIPSRAPPRARDR
jgi:hypothetical protein